MSTGQRENQVWTKTDPDPNTSLCLSRGGTSHVRTGKPGTHHYVLISIVYEILRRDNILPGSSDALLAWSRLPALYTGARPEYWINLPNSIYAETQLYWEFNGTRIEAVLCCTSSRQRWWRELEMYCSWLTSYSILYAGRGWAGSSAEADLIDFILHQTARLMISALCVNNSAERGAKTSLKMLQSATDSIFWGRNIWFWLYYSFYSLSLDLF